MECELLVQVAKQSGHSVKALLRVNPGVEAHTHKYIVTAHLDSKFGTSITHKEEIAHMVQTYPLFLTFTLKASTPISEVRSLMPMPMLRKFKP